MKKILTNSLTPSILERITNSFSLGNDQGVTYAFTVAKNSSHLFPLDATFYTTPPSAHAYTCLLLNLASNNRGDAEVGTDGYY